MDIMKKRISLVLSIIMLALVIIPVVNVNATEKCQVSMTAKMGSKTLVDEGRYNVQGGETITVSAKSSVADIAFISYFFSTESYEERKKIKDNVISIEVPYEDDGSVIKLYVEPVATNDNGKPNTITKTGWQEYTLVYPNCEIEDKDIAVSYNNEKVANKTTTIVKPGEKINVKVTPADKMEALYYRWCKVENVNSTKTANTTSAEAAFRIPADAKDGDTYTLVLNALFADNRYADGNINSDTVPERYYFEVEGNEDDNNNNNDNNDNVVGNKDIKVTVDGKELNNGSTTEVKVGEKVVITVSPTADVEKVYYKWNNGTTKNVAGNTYTFVIPSDVTEGSTYQLNINALFADGLYIDDKTTGTVPEMYKFKIVGEEEPSDIDRELIIEPWMEENDDIEELSISLRNDSEEEDKANKNIYELGEKVTYYIDYKNGGKDIDDDVTIVLDLPLDFEIIDLDGGEINSDDEIEWVFENGLEEGEEGTIVVEIAYTDLKKSKDDANTIYPSASILKGSKVKDVSTVVNFIITEYDEELDIDHDPYMYGDADADTFRPDYLITRAEGALVLARIYGLDYENITTITTKYTDINDTYLEAQQAITAASNAGLINGYLEDDGTYTYRPNSKMTKAEFMKILACMVQEGAEDEDIDGLQIKELEQLVKIYDDSKRYYMVEGERVYTHWAIEEITLLARLNMLPLNSDNTEFELDEKITRAEVAQLINFYLLRAPADVTSKTKTGFSDVSRKHELVGDIIEATRASHTFSITTEATEVEE